MMPSRPPLGDGLESYEYEHVVEKDKAAQRAGTQRRARAFYVFGVSVRSVTVFYWASW